MAEPAPVHDAAAAVAATPEVPASHASETTPAATTPEAPPVDAANPPPTEDPKHEAERVEVKAMPVRQYLETTVVPLLLQGLQHLVLERPTDPIEFLSEYLSNNNPKKKPPPAPEEAPTLKPEAPADGAASAPASAADAPAAGGEAKPEGGLPEAAEALGNAIAHQPSGGAI